MKKALSQFYKSVEVERTLKDEILDLIEFISQFDWECDYWRFIDSSAHWSSSISDLDITVIIKVIDNSS